MVLRLKLAVQGSLAVGFRHSQIIGGKVCLFSRLPTLLTDLNTGLVERLPNRQEAFAALAVCAAKCANEHSGGQHGCTKE